MPLVWASETRLRCGDNPRSPTCHVTEAEAALIEAIRAGADPSTIEIMTRAAGITPRRARRLIAFIRPSLRAPREPTLDALVTSGELSDATTAPRADALRQRRHGHRLHLAGDARYHDLSRWMLERTGVAVIDSFDAPDPTVPHQVGAAGTRTVGLLVSGPVAHPQLMREWMRCAVPHVVVSVMAHGVEVSHLVVPGTTPCLTCRERRRTDDDPTWPFSAAQLAAREVAEVERTVASTAIAVAIAAILAHIDGDTPPMRHGARIQPYGINPTEAPQFHPECGCREFSSWLAASA